MSLEKIQKLIINIHDNPNKIEKEFQWFEEKALTDKEINRGREDRKNQVFLSDKDFETGNITEVIKQQNENRKEYITKKAVCDSGKEAKRFRLTNGTDILGLLLKQDSKGFILQTLDNEEKFVGEKEIAKILHGYQFSELDCK